MTNFAFSLIALATGAVIGGVSVWLVQKSKYEAKLEEEMSNYRKSRNEAERKRRDRAAAKEKAANDIFESLTKEQKETMRLIITEAMEKLEIKKSDPKDDGEFDLGDENESEEEPVIIGPKPGEPDDEEDEDEEFEDEHYVPMFTEEQVRWAKTKTENGDYTEEEMAEELGISTYQLREILDNYEAELAKREYQAVASGYSTSNDPYNIDEEEYEDGEPTYNKELLLYYRGDGTIIFEESDEQMLEIGMCLGNIKKTLRNDRENSDGFIYVRNNTYKTDYKILCINEKFFDET